MDDGRELKCSARDERLDVLAADSDQRPCPKRTLKPARQDDRPLMSCVYARGTMRRAKHCELAV
jgi:hypothetical protein